MAGFGLRSDGSTYSTTTNFGPQEQGNWLTGGSSANYQVMVTVAAGDALAGSAVGTWLALSTTREWYISVSGGDGVKSSSVSVSIRRTSDLAVVATGSVNLNASIGTAI